MALYIMVAQLMWICLKSSPGVKLSSDPDNNKQISYLYNEMEAFILISYQEINEKT